MQSSADLFKLKEPPDLVILREHSEPKDLVSSFDYAQDDDAVFKLKEPPDLVILREHSEPKDLVSSFDYAQDDGMFSENGGIFSMDDSRIVIQDITIKNRNNKIAFHNN